MIEKILNLFFTKKYPHKNKRVTIMKNRFVSDVNFDRTKIVSQKEKKTNDDGLTCLSKYFINNRGFNVKERLGDFN